MPRNRDISQSFQKNANGVSIGLHVQPGSSKTAWAGFYGDRLKLKLSARAVDGQANLALIEFLSESLKIPKSSITITRGLTNRDKTVYIGGDPESICRALESVTG